MRARTVREDLEALAGAHGVATAYEDARHVVRDVPESTVRAVLAAMGVPCERDEQVAAALAAADEAPWLRMLPPSVVVIGQYPRSRRVPLHAPEHVRVALRLEQEDGTSRPLVPSTVEAVREVGGRVITRRTITLPGDLPLGYHTLAATVAGGGGREERAVVISAPARCPTAPELEAGWGWMLQLYALRSEVSWGVGDLGDLRTLAAWSGSALGAAFVVCNPLHAVTPVTPVEPSPYYPSSRRFQSPLYLRVDDLPEFGEAAPLVRRRLERLAGEARTRNRRDLIDRDASWQAKSEALELLRGVPPERARRSAFHAFRAAGGDALETFATFCALAERHGHPWQRWPEALRHPTSPAVATAAEQLADRVTYHTWLQFLVAEQLAEAQREARAAGMPLGIVHDLAVGVDPGGADAWALQDDLAPGVTIGAPPDPFNQQGQDWRLPPLRPDRLAETAYAPFRDMLAPLLARGGGVRLDHVLGLFRQWWVPEGRDPTEGTYVRYPSRELLAVLALESTRAGAVVVGEDLGTVTEEVREALGAAGVLGSRVVYFERTSRDDLEPERRLRPGEYPRDALASVTTHDLPTAAGWWADEDVRVREDLGLLAAGTTPEAERARKAAEREEMRALLHAEGLVAADEDDPDTLAAALHGFLARTASRLVAVQPADAVGDRRQPNVPGTTDAYPNWRLPVAEPTAAGPRPVLLEDLMGDERVDALAALLRDGRALVRERAR